MKDLHGHKIIENRKWNSELREILENHNINKIMVVSGTTYEKTYLKEWFEQMPFQFVQYAEFSQNPNYKDICEGAKLFREEQCNAIISVGGGSAIDTAKGIKMFAALDPKYDYLNQKPQESDIVHICVPTTAGSGSEANGNAVFYVEEEKYSYYHENCIPDYIYYEPEFLKTLPETIKKASLADAIAQCIESIWAKNATKESINYAVKGLRILLEYTMQYLRGEESSYEPIQLGAFYSGKAIGIGKTTAAHALSYALGQKCNIVHGQAVFMLLPAVFDRTVKKLKPEMTVLKERLDIIRSIVYPGAENYEKVTKQLQFIFQVLGLEVPSFVGEEVVQELTDNVNVERLSNHPVPLTSKDIYDIYLDAFQMVYDDGGNLVQAPFYTQFIERKKFVKGLQDLTLETLILTKKFMEEYNLRFFLGEGTMLGAVRHHGFIPWDDDIDILMPREDYDRMVELAKNGKIPSELNLDALENNDKHWVLGAKMQLVRETEYIQEKVIPLSKYHGPYVDIFPLDYWPKESSLSQKWADLNVKLCRRMLFMKTGYSKATNKRLIRIILKLVIVFMTNRQIENYAIRNMKKFYKKQHNYMVNLCSYYPYYKQIFPKECYQKIKIISFEGYEMPIPMEYDIILKKIYGEKYDSIPPYVVVNMRQHTFLLKKDNE